MFSIIFENTDLNSFNNAHRFFINNDFVLSTSSSFLEIIIDNDIYEIIDETLIQHYRKTNMLPNNEHIIKKTIINNEEYVNNEYDHNAIIKDFTITENKSNDNIADLPKQFAMKKRLTYKNNKSKVSYQCEIINHSNQVDVDFRNINLNTKTPKYKYYVLSDEKLEVDYHIREMHFILDNNIMPLKKEEQDNILKNYVTLITSMFSKRGKDNLKDNIVIIAPKSITLEKHNLVSVEEYGTTSIFENYAVTEKADGNRYFLYVNDHSNVYLIDTATKEVRGCNIKTSLKNCLLDGELILCQDRLINKQRDLFAIFDIYYYNAEKVSTLPLLAEDKTAKSRYNLMKEFVKHITHFYSHDIIVKEQLTSNNILNNCNEILSNEKEYDYNIDGLIFTPTKLGVFSYYANKPVELDNINNFNWNKVLKWKPPEQNTIDFIVIERQKHKLKSDGKIYKEYTLNIVYNNTNMDPISVNKGLKILNGIEAKSVESVYTLRPFTIDDIEQKVFIQTDINGKCYTTNNEEILNHSVVEFSYDNLTVLLAKEKKWIPLRIRHDKNKVYNFGQGEINKTANSYLVATGIWRSITNEVSTNIITGKQPIETNIKKYLTGLDTYYTRNISSNNLISNKMNMFHNHIIKDMLYRVDVTLRGNTKALLELACGQGSDIRRWDNNRFNYILGVDYTLDNITNPKAGVYSRYLNNNYLKTKYKVFVAGDCSKSLRNGKAAENIDKESRDVLKHIFERPNKDYGYIKNFPTSFQLVSCMFSVHYFFENEDMLDGFVKNVAENLEKSGKLILTFMDKALVKKELDKNNGKVVGKDSTSDSTVWAIIRNFNPHQQSKYNQKIDVFIENTGRLISENLVDLNVLVSKLSYYKIDLQQTKTFEETFKQKLEDETIKPREREILENLNSDKNLKRFSFLNRWCIFQKQV